MLTASYNSVKSEREVKKLVLTASYNSVKSEREVKKKGRRGGGQGTPIPFSFLDKKKESMPSNEIMKNQLHPNVNINETVTAEMGGMEGQYRLLMSI